MTPDLFCRKDSYGKTLPLRKADISLIKKYLREIPLFKNLSDLYMKRIINDFSVMCVKKGQTVVFQSDEGTDLYIMLTGRVKVNLLDPEGNEFVLTVFEPRDFFGELSLIDGKPRSASVTAEQNSSIGILKRDKFITMIKHDPRLSYKLLLALSERLRKSDEMIESLVFLDVRERLMRYFLHLINQQGVKEQNGYLKITKLTHKELASRIGASRESISKVLKILSLKHAVIEKNKHFFISSDEFGNTLDTKNLLS